MSRPRLAACLVIVGVLAGTAAPALAGGDDDNSYICVMATHDKNNPGKPTLCVWAPIDKSLGH
jgi:hypothetical protein